MKPSLGRILLVRTIVPYNNSHIHPAIVNRVWSDTCVNVTVLPDCGAPFCLTSVWIVAELPPQDPVAPQNLAFWPPHV